MAAACLIRREVHDRPAYAPADAGLNAGGPLETHPYFLSDRVNLAYPPAPGRCGRCQNDATVCLYFDYSEGQVDKFGVYEVGCPACGAFTACIYAD